MRQNAFGGLGELQRSPRPSSCNYGVPTSKGREGRGGQSKELKGVRGRGPLPLSPPLFGVTLRP